MYRSTSLSVERRLRGSFSERFWQELFRNTGQFPIGILLIEAMLEGRDYLFKPDMYVLIPSALAQAWWLARQPEGRGWQRFVGNLIAPALYTVGEVMIEGMKFFQSPHHVAYWGFAVLIGLLQALRPAAGRFFANLLLVLENIIRAQILLTAYILFEVYTNPAQTGSLTVFLGDPSHVLIGLITLLLGLVVALADVNARRSLALLRDTAEKLKTYSEWLLGRDLLGRALDDPESMRLTRKKRTVLFMDIRGFTQWSEKRPPEAVAVLMNEYYQAIETVLEAYQVIKYKFIADAVMAVFISGAEAIQAAHDLRAAMQLVLGSVGLSAGIGLHTGTVVEGLLGGGNLQFYDVLGDTVNTASRIESATAGNEILISEALCDELGYLPTSTKKEIHVKGKEKAVKVFSIS